jgi:DNA-binding NtrC family response regulator
MNADSIVIGAGLGRRVLIVEDEPRLRDMLTRAVGEMGFTAWAVGSAESALRGLDQKPADILIVDLNLPGMSGIDFLENARARWPAVQSIVLTGFGDLESARRAIHLEVVEFLSKPCALGDLEAALERARRKSVQQSPPAAITMPREERTVEPSPAVAAPVPGSHESLEDMERQHILATLARHNGNRATTAAELKISIRTLYYRLGLYQKQGYLKNEE